MIPISLTEAVRQKFKEWFHDHKDELEQHFERYLEDSGKGWISTKHKKTIQALLFPLFNRKCAYCERSPNMGGAFIQLDHFYPKSQFRDSVFVLENLVIACSQCNTVKGIRYKDKNGEEMLHPYEKFRINEHLRMNRKNLMLEGVSKNGKATVGILNLSLNAPSYEDENGCSYEGAIAIRAIIQETINDKLEVLDMCKDNEIFDKLKKQTFKLIEMITAKNYCTAAFATLILQNPKFQQLIQFIREQEPKAGKELDDLIAKKEQYCFR